jgi:hypothetical protein
MAISPESQQRRRSINKVLLVVVGLLIALVVIIAILPDANEKNLEYEIVGERDTSHGLAKRVTLFVRVASDYTRDEIKQIAAEVTSQHQDSYDIIWLDIVPSDAKPPNKGTWKWRPVLCKTKWVSPDLGEQFHTTGDGFEAAEMHGDIAVSWFNMTGAAMGQLDSLIYSKADTESFFEKARVLVPALVGLGDQVAENYAKIDEPGYSMDDFENFMRDNLLLQDSLSIDALNDLGVPDKEHKNYRWAIAALASDVNALFVCFDSNDLTAPCDSAEKRRRVESALDLFGDHVAE